LVDTGIENQRFLAGIAHIRSYYRTLTPEAAVYFSAESGRWPEAHPWVSLRLGPVVAFFTTAATMIAFINSVVAGAGFTLLASNLLVGDHTLFALSIGVAAALAIMAAFLAFQRWMYRVAGAAEARGLRSETEHRTD
jgi:hypothetical protein